MNLEASGGAGAVHPILGGGGRRRLPRWIWLAVLIVMCRLAPDPGDDVVRSGAPSRC